MNTDPQRDDKAQKMQGAPKAQETQQETQRETQREAQAARLGDIFGVMDQSFAETVVERAAKHRTHATPNARKALNAALRTSVKVNGYRDASRAGPRQLVAATLHEIDHGDDRLAGAVLKVWDESQSALRGLVTEQLGRENVPVHDANIKRRHFEVCWRRDDWVRSRDALLKGHADLNEDDVALMLCLVSGRMPLPDDDLDDYPIESPRFERWLEELDNLPCNAREWKDAGVFAECVIDIAHHKIDELINGETAALEDAIKGVREKFADELRYLEIDMHGWFKQASARLQIMPEAQDLLAGFKEQLQTYRPIRPQAAVRDEEKRRMSERAQCEEALLKTVQQWHELMSCPADRPYTPTGQVAEAREEYRTTQDNPSAAETQELQALREEVERIRAGYGLLESESARLKEAKDGIQLEKAQLSEHIGELKSQLAQSQETEQYWRQAYVGEKARTNGEGMEIGAPPANVAQVVDRIGRSFPDEIVFALNGKSRKNHPFEKPHELYQALAWLATEFHRLRPNPGPSPDFDRLIKEACPGWSYKPNQTETTMGMYAEWYRTTVNGKSYDLANHIGKGNSFDPKNTIRIAFAWDDDNQRIVVGFIGLHQRNRQS